MGTVYGALGIEVRHAYAHLRNLYLHEIEETLPKF